MTERGAMYQIEVWSTKLRKMVRSFSNLASDPARHAVLIPMKENIDEAVTRLTEAMSGHAASVDLNTLIEDANYCLSTPLAGEYQLVEQAVDTVNSPHRPPTTTSVILKTPSRPARKASSIASSRSSIARLELLKRKQELLQQERAVLDEMATLQEEIHADQYLGSDDDLLRFSDDAPENDYDCNKNTASQMASYVSAEDKANEVDDGKTRKSGPNRVDENAASKTEVPRKMSPLERAISYHRLSSSRNRQDGNPDSRDVMKVDPDAGIGAPAQISSSDPPLSKSGTDNGPDGNPGARVPEMQVSSKPPAPVLRHDQHGNPARTMPSVTRSLPDTVGEPALTINRSGIRDSRDGVASHHRSMMPPSTPGMRRPATVEPARTIDHRRVVQSSYDVTPTPSTAYTSYQRPVTTHSSTVTMPALSNNVTRNWAGDSRAVTMDASVSRPPLNANAHTYCPPPTTVVYSTQDYRPPSRVSFADPTADEESPLYANVHRPQRGHLHDSPTVSTNLMATSSAHDNFYYRRDSSPSLGTHGHGLAPPPSISDGSTFSHDTDREAARTRVQRPPPRPYYPGYGDQQSAAPLDMVSQMRLAMSLPKIEIVTFSGAKGEDYMHFRETVVNVIEHNCVDEGLRLQQLLSRTTGKSRSYIKDCIYLDKAVGYREARRILDERYGTPADIVRSALDKLSKGAPIKLGDREGLLDFHAEVLAVSRKLSRLDCRLDADAPERLKSIVARLPHNWKTRFIRSLGVHMPEYTDLVVFLNESIKSVRNPFYTDCFESTVKKPENPNPNRDRRRRNDDSFFNDFDDSKPDKPDGPGRKDKRPNRRNPKKDKQSPEVQAKCVFCKTAKSHPPRQCPLLRSMKVDERVAALVKARRCLNCLISTEHVSRKCDKPSFCEHEECAKSIPHSQFCHPLPYLKSLLREKSDADSSNTADGKFPSEKESGEDGSCHVSATSGGSGTTLPQLIPVQLRDENNVGKCTTYGMLDSGANSVIVDRRIQDYLRIRGKSRRWTVRGSTSVNDVPVELVNLVASSIDGTGPSVFLPNARSIENCPFTQSKIPSPDALRQWEHLRDVPLPDLDTIDFPFVGILIGTNAQECFLPEGILKGENGPLAIKGLLGWSILGNQVQVPAADADANNDGSISCCTLTRDERHRENMEMFWKIEQLAGDTRQDVGMSVNDTKALKMMTESKRLTEDEFGPHFEVGIPWHVYPPPLSNNRRKALRLMIALKNRLKRNESLFKMYAVQMNEYVKNGYAVSLRDQPLHDVTGMQYIPHHGVFHDKKPGKIRVVYNCSDEDDEGMSLNKSIYSGPDFTNKLVEILIRWREGFIAITGDVEAMYHRVRVTERDMTYLRFLWFRNNDLDAPIDDYYMRVHLFGCISSSACASFALRCTAEEFQNEVPKYVVESVIKSFYVDDWAQSHDDICKAVQHREQLTKLLKFGGFNLKKFDSNSKVVMESVPECDRSPLIAKLGEGRVQSILGLRWMVEKDNILLCSPSPPKPSTRSGILGFMMSRYDPLGLESPVSFAIKCFLQDLCRLKIGWNEELPPPQLIRWHQMLQDIHSLSNIEIQRCYKSTDSPTTETQLHTFSDASSLGYAAVSYLRTLHEDDAIDVALVTGKARVAPLRPPTIRRLELQGAVTASKLSTVAESALDVKPDRVFYWTDCQCVLKYLANETKRFSVYVTNRLTQIRDLSSDHDQWMYVKSSENVADDATRLLDLSQFGPSSRWFTGPEFLSKPGSFDSGCEEISTVLEDDDPEVKDDLVVCTVEDRWSFTDIFVARFSRLEPLLNSTAWLIRFIQYRQAELQKKTETVVVGPVTVAERRDALSALLRVCQFDIWPQEVATARKHASRPTSTAGSHLPVSATAVPVCTTSPLYNLGVVWMNGLLCLRGRLAHADVRESTRHPVLVPSIHHLTKLLIRDCHCKHGHLGMNYVLGELRLKYWIIDGKSTVKRELAGCHQCKRYNARPMSQLMADLPPERVIRAEYPWKHVGLDAFGPFYVKIGRRVEKRWVMIFSCLTFRCVHFEIVHTMNTDSFIMAYRRFIGRRGKVSTIVSDRGSNFLSADKELRRRLASWNDAKIQRELRQNETEWKFNAAGASHHGGVYERLIRSARSVLHHVLTETTTDEQFQTVIVETESILNGRPLEPVSSDPNDISALTPNHVILLRSNPNLPPGLFKSTDSPTRKRWLTVQHICNRVWRHLLRNYLAALNVRSKWNKIRDNVSVGDLVLLTDTKCHRSEWKLARVTRVMKGRDGLVRSVGLRTASSDITRPITKICMLERGNASR